MDLLSLLLTIFDAVRLTLTCAPALVAWVAPKTDVTSSPPPALGWPARPAPTAAWAGVEARRPDPVVMVVREDWGGEAALDKPRRVSASNVRSAALESDAAQDLEAGAQVDCGPLRKLARRCGDPDVARLAKDAWSSRQRRQIDDDHAGESATDEATDAEVEDLLSLIEGPTWRRRHSASADLEDEEEFTEEPALTRAQARTSRARASAAVGYGSPWDNTCIFDDPYTVDPGCFPDQRIVRPQESASQLAAKDLEKWMKTTHKPVDLGLEPVIGMASKDSPKPLDSFLQSLEAQPSTLTLRTMPSPPPAQKVPQPRLRVDTDASGRTTRVWFEYD